MNYPSLEQYNQALQHPEFALIDPNLKTGKITTTGLGLPLALCGGFALTYTLNANSHKYAIRCFHKNSRNLEQRYGVISNKLKLLRSIYFVDFEFQSNGIRINNNTYPIVKMAWADGQTMGEFVESNYREKSKLSALITALRSLGLYLENQKIAHGDIQPGNVMVSAGGQRIQLIDYDGMYVDGLQTFGSSEIGHKNFQHPLRNNDVWDTSLDRFSLISLNIALRALIDNPTLWKTTQSDGDSFLFRANDYLNPDQSIVFGQVSNLTNIKDELRNFKLICRSSYQNIPSLEDYLQNRNIPKASVTFTPTISRRYISPYIVLDASNYYVCEPCVGDRVEIIGKVIEVKKDYARNKLPYVFINFGNWKGKIVKGAIWSEGLRLLSDVPDSSWEGKWISVVGLLEPPYHSKQYGYTHLAINITQSNQLHVIDEKEAQYRLGSSNRVDSMREFLEGPSNRQIMDDIRINRTNRVSSSTSSTSPQSSNQKVLAEIKKNVTQLSSPPTSQPSGNPPKKPIVSPLQTGNNPKPSKKSGNHETIGILIGLLFVMVICVLIFTSS